MFTTLLTLALAASGGAADSHLAFDTGPAPEVKVENVRGPITVSAAAGDKSEVDAVYSGPDSARGQWSVEIHGEKGHLQARVCCGPCGAFFHGSCDDDGQVALTLRVPAGSTVSASNVSGGVQVASVSGALSIHEVSGAASLSGTGSAVSVNTVSGKVRVAMAQPGPVALRSVSGNVDVALPPSAGADVSLQTVSGRLNGKSVGVGSAQVRVGPGGISVSANTVSGNLDVHR